MAISSFFIQRKKLVLKGSLQSTVRQIAILPHGKVILGACDDGLYAWDIDYIGSKDHVRYLSTKYIYLSRMVLEY